MVAAISGAGLGLIAYCVYGMWATYRISAQHEHLACAVTKYKTLCDDAVNKIEVHLRNTPTELEHVGTQASIPEVLRGRQYKTFDASALLLSPQEHLRFEYLMGCAQVNTMRMYPNEDSANRLLKWQRSLHQLLATIDSAIDATYNREVESALLSGSGIEVNGVPWTEARKRNAWHAWRRHYAVEYSNGILMNVPWRKLPLTTELCVLKECVILDICGTFLHMMGRAGLCSDTVVSETMKAILNCCHSREADAKRVSAK